MLSSKHGTVEVKAIFLNGFTLKVNKKEYFLDFKNHPYFKSASIKDIFDVKLFPREKLRWDNLDVDLNTEILSNLNNYPKIIYHLTASEMGKKGGSSKSYVKRRAAAINGKRGGRPKKRFIRVVSNKKKLIPV